MGLDGFFIGEVKGKIGSQTLNEKITLLSDTYGAQALEFVYYCH